MVGDGVGATLGCLVGAVCIEHGIGMGVLRRSGPQMKRMLHRAQGTRTVGVGVGATVGLLVVGAGVGFGVGAVEGLAVAVTVAT